MATDYLAALNSGSGLDTKSIVSALVEAERAGPQSSIDKRTTAVESTISGLGLLKSAMQTLSDAFANLDDAREFNFSSVSSTNTSVLSATLSGATPDVGTHRVVVDTLAARDTRVSDEQSSKTADLNGGVSATFEFTVGSGATQTINLSAGNASLQNLADEINLLDAGATARIVEVSSERYKLFLESDETGVSNAITINSDFLNIGVEDANHHVQTASDAVVYYNNVEITRSDNSIDDLIEGVELNLQSISGSEITVEITRNTQEAASQISSLVDAINGFETIMDELTDVEQGGALASDSEVTTIRRKIKDFFFQNGSQAGDNIQRANDLGINIDRYGNFSLDENKLLQQLNDNFDEVATFFTADTNGGSLLGEADRGLAGDVRALIDMYLKPTGTIQSRISSQNNVLDDLTDEQVALDERIAASEERHTAKFTTMSKIVDEMNSLQEYLKSQLDNLPFTKKES